MNDPDFDAAWREFAEDDAETMAPERLRPAVMEAWHAAQLSQRDRGETRYLKGRGMPLVAALAAVAAVIVTVVVTMGEMDRWPDRRRSAGASPGSETTPAAVASRATEPDRNAIRRGLGSKPALRVRGSIAGATNAPVDGIRLIADPAFDTESFEIVRLRLPRTSLEAIGVALIGPEIASLVEIDVVVGGDGLPRTIRGIRPVVGIQ